MPIFVVSRPPAKVARKASNKHGPSSIHQVASCGPSPVSHHSTSTRPRGSVSVNCTTPSTLTKRCPQPPSETGSFYDSPRGSTQPPRRRLASLAKPLGNPVLLSSPMGSSFSQSSPTVSTLPEHLVEQLCYDASHEKRVLYDIAIDQLFRDIKSQVPPHLTQLHHKAKNNLLSAAAVVSGLSQHLMQKHNHAFRMDVPLMTAKIVQMQHTGTIGFAGHIGNTVDEAPSGYNVLVAPNSTSIGGAGGGDEEQEEDGLSLPVPPNSIRLDRDDGVPLEPFTISVQDPSLVLKEKKGHHQPPPSPSSLSIGGTLTGYHPRQQIAFQAQLGKLKELQTALRGRIIVSYMESLHMLVQQAEEVGRCSIELVGEVKSRHALQRLEVSSYLSASRCRQSAMKVSARARVTSVVQTQRLELQNETETFEREQLRATQHTIEGVRHALLQMEKGILAYQWDMEDTLTKELFNGIQERTPFFVEFANTV